MQFRAQLQRLGPFRELVVGGCDDEEDALRSRRLGGNLENEHSYPPEQSLDVLALQD